MGVRGTCISSADLLRALKLAEADPTAADRLAEGLGYFREATSSGERESDVTIPPIHPPRPPPGDSVTVPPKPKDPLRCRFLSIVACTVIEEPKPDLSLPAPKRQLTQAECQPERTGRPPVRHLVRPEHLWPAVKRSLAVTTLNGVDLPRLTARMTRGEPVTRLPSLRRHWWGGELLVVWDRSERLAPYASDYETLLAQVLANRGYGGFRLYTVDGLPSQVTGTWCSGLRDAKRVSEIPLPPSGCKVLLLSDLGALAASPTAAWHWQTFARKLGVGGAAPVAWVPHSARQVEVATARLVEIHCLDREGNLRRQRGSIRSSEQRQHEHRRLCELRERLLVRLSFCERLEPVLLRALRQLRPDTAMEPALEGMIWSYQPVVRSSALSRPLAGTHQAFYRARFSSLPPDEQREALACAMTIHQWQGRSTGVLEALIWDSHASEASKTKSDRDKVEKAKRWIAAFRHSLLQAEGDYRARAAEFAGDLLSRNWHDTQFQSRHSRWLSEFWALTGRQDLPRGLHAADVERATADGSMERQYQLAQVNANIMMWPLAQPLPAFAVSRLGSPLKVNGVELHTEDPPTRRWVALNEHPTELLESGADVASCSLIAGGRRYSMAVLERPPWATAFGRDRFGTFAEFSLSTSHGTAVQRLRYIEPGSFLMGSSEGEPGRDDDEGPQHTVTISRGYWLADTTCTQALWQVVIGENPSRFQSPDRPVEQVSWGDVQVFLQRLEELLVVVKADLPTEAEWEYACRAGTDTALYTGTLEILGERDAPSLDPIAWYGGNSGVGFELDNGVDFSFWPEKQYSNSASGTHPVGRKQPNPWGLHDMLGNVWEWCADGLRDYTAESAEDPVGSADEEGPFCSVRGGSWFGKARWVRAAYRGRIEPTLALNDLGFRLSLRSIDSSAKRWPRRRKK